MSEIEISGVEMPGDGICGAEISVVQVSRVEMSGQKCPGENIRGGNV
jgi:hypothetical protein